MADPVVHITNGLPDSGTGNITTLGQTLLDGAQVTQGAIADAAVAAGATGTLSAKLRSISRDLVANIVLAAGANVIGKVGVDQTTPGTTDSVTVATGQGAGATIGAVADAAVAAGAGGTLSAKLRSISRDLVANIVLAAGANIIGKVGVDQTTPGTTDSVTVSTGQGAGAAIGAVSGAAVTTNANGTLQQYLRGLVTLFMTATFKAASTAPIATDPALVVSISPNSVNANGLTAASGSAPVVIAPQTLDVTVTPTVTASAYTANNIIGGIMTFASILPSVGNNGVLQSITAKFKATAVTGNITVAIFKANPSNGTYADKTAGTYNSADMANLIGIYVLTTPLPLGAYTMTVYNLDGIGKAFVGSSTSLFAIATVAGTPTPASTSDFSLELSVLPG